MCGASTLNCFEAVQISYDDLKEVGFSQSSGWCHMGKVGLIVILSYMTMDIFIL